MSANERRPAGAASEAWRPGPIVLADALDELADTLSWYEAGLMHGIDLGHRQAEDEHRGRMEAGAAIARMVAQRGPYDVLADRRGQHGRAEAQRAILRDRGIA